MSGDNTWLPSLLTPSAMDTRETTNPCRPHFGLLSLTRLIYSPAPHLEPFTNTLLSYCNKIPVRKVSTVLSFKDTQN